MSFLAELTGCFSTGAADNPTVEIVGAAYRHHNLNFRYINCEVPPEKLEAAVAGARAMGWVGFNCSLPHKVNVIKYLDGLGTSAKIIGAVNCAVLRDGRFIGENTDGKGFLASLQTIADPVGKTIVIFGAGGAARAISVELALAGAAEIRIVNRDEEKGKILVDLLNLKTKIKAELVSWKSTYAIPKGIDIIVNATSIGMTPNVDQKLDVRTDTFRDGQVFADVIVNPPLTHLIREASARGCKVLNGQGMIVNQAVLGIKYWTEQDVDSQVMLDTLQRLAL